MDFTKPETVLNLDNIRSSLIRMEETIVFEMIERAQFQHTKTAYVPGAIAIPHFTGSFLDWFLMQTEKNHSKIRRYQAPDEVPYFPSELEEPILPPLNYPPVLASYHKEVSVNNQIKEYYINSIVPSISAGEKEQPDNIGSCTLTDITCLQALSRRIHFGSFVAESKFQSEKEKFIALIKANDVEGIERAITNVAVEKQVLKRLETKAEAYGVDPTLHYSQRAQGKVDPKVVVKIYEEFIIPLTKKVEVDYLLRRLEED
jgi:chorismate mutase